MKISSRAIIINNDKLLIFYRKRLVNGVIEEYYSIPGGKVEGNESLEECAIRELKEEMNIDIELLGYLGSIENTNDITEGIANFFHAKLVNGTPTLCGEELDENCETNFYEIQEIPLSEINNIKLYDREMVIKAINKEYKNI